MNNIRILRRRRKISMKELGQIVGVAESTISLYETGKREPDLKTLQILADYFGVSVDYLIGHEAQTSDNSFADDFRKRYSDAEIAEMIQKTGFPAQSEFEKDMKELGLPVEKINDLPEEKKQLLMKAIVNLAKSFVE